MKKKGTEMSEENTAPESQEEPQSAPVSGGTVGTTNVPTEPTVQTPDADASAPEEQEPTEEQDAQSEQNSADRADAQSNDSDSENAPE